MPFQVGGLVETLSANVALVRKFTRVESQMPFQVGRLVETLSANVALVRKFARVRPQVVFHVAQLFARLGAKVALVNRFSVLPLQRVRIRHDSAALAPSRRTARIDRR